MTSLRIHHRGYSFLWDLLDLAQSAFRYTAPLAPQVKLALTPPLSLERARPPTS